MRRLRRIFQRKPTLSDAGSQLCTASQFKENVYDIWLKEIKEDHRYHRKQWEYVYILQVLNKYDMLRASIKGLGFGCGKEPLSAVMAKKGCHIMATDVEPGDIDDNYWGATNISDLYFPNICSEEILQERVSFSYADMNHISETMFDEYDFLWSCCALEHIGSLKAGMDFILNSTKCLKPGGIAVHTTEINLNQGDETMETPGLSLYRKRDIKDLEAQLSQMCCSMLPVNWYTGDLPEDNYVDLPPYGEDKHLKLQIEQFVVTSLGIVIIKD